MEFFYAVTDVMKQNQCQKNVLLSTVIFILPSDICLPKKKGNFVKVRSKMRVKLTSCVSIVPILKVLVFFDVTGT